MYVYMYIYTASLYDNRASNVYGSHSPLLTVIDTMSLCGAGSSFIHRSLL